MKTTGGSVALLVLMGCAAAGEPVAAPTPPPRQERVGHANLAVQSQQAQEAEANRVLLEGYKTEMARNQLEAEARAKVAVEAEATRKKQEAEAAARMCRDSRPVRRKALLEELRVWQAFALRVGKHRQAILDRCRIGEGGTKVTRLPGGGAKMQALSVDDRLECRGGGVPGGVSREDAVTSMQVDYDDPIAIEDDGGCASVDAADGEPTPRVTITDLLRKPKP